MDNALKGSECTLIDSAGNLKVVYVENVITIEKLLSYIGNLS